ncbi:MAG: hypothetical protein FWB72_04745 [Firmicutes bacterium]|nr:hypothetical protein [Bacillota bacterium]
MACIKDKCICPKKDCTNNGKCCACVAAHREKGSPTFCMKQKDEDKNK